MPTWAISRADLLDGSFQHHLLRDAARLRAWADAVAAVVRPGDVVVDLGSGTGVLAHLALRAGARKVFAVEGDRASFGTLQRLLVRNGIAGQVETVRADVTAWAPPEPVDVAVCEVMESGLLHEPAAAAVRHIHRAWPEPRPRAVVPAGVELWVEGVTLHDDFLGYQAPLPGFRAGGSGEACTTAARYAAFAFGKEAPPKGVDAAFVVTATRDARLDALRVRTVSHLAEGVTFETGPAYCTPLVLPLQEPLHVRAGAALEGSIAYGFAYDESPVRVAVEA